MGCGAVQGRAQTKDCTMCYPKRRPILHCSANPGVLGPGVAWQSQGGSHWKRTVGRLLTSGGEGRQCPQEEEGAGASRA